MSVRPAMAGQGAEDLSPGGRLQEAGVRPTLQRQAVLDVYERHGDQALHPQDVLRVMLQEGHQASLASIYRHVRELEQAGLLHKEWSRSRVATRAAYRAWPNPSARSGLPLFCNVCRRPVGQAQAAVREALAQLLRQSGCTVQPTEVLVVAADCPHCKRGRSTAWSGRRRAT
jgi:Fur family transcriptional regulator, ferric uptake regulator